MKVFYSQAGLLAIANRVHADVPALLAIKLPLLQSRPELIFAGESRTVYQVDPDLAAQLFGRPKGAAVNIAYDAGEPLALLRRRSRPRPRPRTDAGRSPDGRRQGTAAGDGRPLIVRDSVEAPSD